MLGLSLERDLVARIPGSCPRDDGGRPRLYGPDGIFRSLFSVDVSNSPGSRRFPSALCFTSFPLPF